MQINLVRFCWAHPGRCLKLLFLLTLASVICVLFHYELSPRQHWLRIGPALLESKTLDDISKNSQEDKLQYNKLKNYFNRKKNSKLIAYYSDSDPHFLMDKDSPERKFYDKGLLESDKTQLDPKMRNNGKPKIADPPKESVKYVEIPENQKKNISSRNIRPTVKSFSVVKMENTEKTTPHRREKLIRFKDRQIMVEKSYKEKSGHDVMLPPKQQDAIVTGSSPSGNTKKWNGILPLCKDFYYQFKMHDVRCLFMSMFDPGNCSLVSDTSKKFMPGVNDSEQDKLVKWGFHELWDACLHPWLTHNTGRFCLGMPSFFHHNTFMQHYTTDPVAQASAIDALGSKCYHSKLSIYITPTNVEHKGGPRKVINNLLSSLRIIGKVYYINGHDLSIYDYKVVLDPFHRMFFYHLNMSDKPWNYYLGPTVAAFQFDSSKISNASRDYVHIVGASKQALDKTDQYFPGLPMPRENAVIIPTPVDTEFFKPNVSYTQRKPKVTIFYFKIGCNQYVFSLMREEVIRKGLAITEVNYGSYDEIGFRNILQNVRFAVLCDGYETQGLAVEEMMSMDVPIFVIGSDSVPYFSTKVGMIYSPNIPLPEAFDEFYNRVRLGEYSPRKWVNENLGMVPAGINFMKVLCQQKNPWN